MCGSGVSLPAYLLDLRGNDRPIYDVCSIYDTS